MAQKGYNKTHSIDGHAQIFTMLVQMSRNVGTLEPSNPDPAVFESVARQLGALREELARHFHAEESSGMFSRLRETLPAATAEVDQLLEEHRVILANLEAARARAQRCTPLSAEQLRTDLETVLEILYTHEMVEEQLVTQAAGPPAMSVVG